MSKTLPKKIAGVKIPRSVRKGGWGDFLTSAAGRALITEAVTAAAGAAAVVAKQKTKGLVGKVRKDIPHKKHANKTAAVVGATAAAGVLAYALSEAIRSFSEALERKKADLAEPSWEAAEADPVATTKPVVGAPATPH